VNEEGLEGEQGEDPILKSRASNTICLYLVVSCFFLVPHCLVGASNQLAGILFPPLPAPFPLPIKVIVLQYGTMNYSL